MRMTNPLAPLLEAAPVSREMAPSTIGEGPWTATSLLSALAEMLTAFLFFAGAAISYFTSKFIRFFNLHPPCFDRGAPITEQRSSLKRNLFHSRLSKEFCKLSNSFRQSRKAGKTTACEPCSSSTTWSEVDSVSSLESRRPSQLSLLCRTRRQIAMQETSRHCFRHPRSIGRDCDKIALLKTRIPRETDASPSQKHRSGCRPSAPIRLPQPSGKRNLDCLSLPGLCRVSSQDAAEVAEAEATQLEREHSLKVFPEELIDFHSLSLEHEWRTGRDKLQDLGTLDSVHDISLGGDQATEPRIQQCPDELDEARHKSTGSSERGESPVNVGDNVKNGTHQSDQLNNLAEDCTLIEASIIVRDKISNVPGSESDDDVVKLKKKLAVEREILNNTYLKLENERMASAAATDEAMAMITRLQEDKAALQMEAVHFQRIADEKAMFDEDATVVLRDTLLKREAEVLTLEKEIELYRRKLLNERIEAVDGMRDSSVWEGDDEEIPLLELEGSTIQGQFRDAPRLTIEGSVSGHRGLIDLGGSKTEGHGDQESMAAGCAHSGNIFCGKLTITHGQGPFNPRNVPTLSQASLQVQSTSSIAARLLDDNGHDRRMARKPRRMADQHEQHVLERIWNLEEQIYCLKTKQDLNTEKHGEALTSQQNTEHGMTGRSLKEKKNSSNSAARRIVHFRHLGAQEPGKSLVSGREEDGNSLIVPRINKTLDHDTMNKYPTNPYFNGLIENPFSHEMGWNEGGREGRYCGGLPDVYLADEMSLTGSNTPNEELSGTTLSPSTLLTDEERTDVNNDAQNSTPGVSSCDFRTTAIIPRDRSSMILEEVQKLMYRLQALERDRELMTQTMKSMRKERAGMETLQDLTQQLRLLQISKGKLMAPETFQQVNDASYFFTVECFD